ncbi:hypothetical protein [Streptomyces sp. NPDC093225]|uniref:hypothetical protein n=1 Tax=Streptomyces sp. NPDC093225 TaxID=3366034 RepID=UPI0038170B2B
MSLSPDFSRPQLVAVPSVCHLCGAPATAGVTTVLHPSGGPPRHLALCMPCDSGRPGRGRTDLGPADDLWWVLTRDAEALRGAFASGEWVPYPSELAFAEALALAAWSEDAIRAAQRAAPRGRLALLLDNLALVLRFTPGHDPAFTPVRRLVDVLANAARDDW